MRRAQWMKASTLALALGVAPLAVAVGRAQAPAQGPPAPRFPAQLRPPDDPAIVERGRGIYGISCRACHGADLRGGDMGGPNLLRSSTALNDVRGETIGAIVISGRGSMPALNLPPDELTAVAAYVRSVLAAGQAQGAPPKGEPIALNIVVGDAAAGQAYFTRRCSACHAADGDLRGIGSRVADPMELQNLWVGGGRDRVGLSSLDPPTPRDPVVTVKPVSAAPVTGRLQRIDDFTVTLVLVDGTQRTFRRVEDSLKVEIKDPLEAHRSLLQQYTDRDVHDVTAYLVTLR
jgi:cytochrome c oxidase cbb3-type subunit 3